MSVSSLLLKCFELAPALQQERLRQEIGEHQQTEQAGVQREPGQALARQEQHLIDAEQRPQRERLREHAEHADDRSHDQQQRERQPPVRQEPDQRAKHGTRRLAHARAELGLERVRRRRFRTPEQAQRDRAAPGELARLACAGPNRPARLGNRRARALGLVPRAGEQLREGAGGVARPAHDAGPSQPLEQPGGGVEARELGPAGAVEHRAEARCAA
jgi:hypothetical protein